MKRTTMTKPACYKARLGTQIECSTVTITVGYLTCDNPLPSDLLQIVLIYLGWGNSAVRTPIVLQY